MTELLGVRFFSKMEVRRNRVFEKMNQEKSGKNIAKRTLSRKPHGLRNNIDQRHGQHVARAQRQKILQEPTRPFLANHEVSAQ